MPDHTETCQECGQPMVLGHSLAIDGARMVIRLCCLCTGSFLARLGKKDAHA